MVWDSAPIPLAPFSGCQGPSAPPWKDLIANVAVGNAFHFTHPSVVHHCVLQIVVCRWTDGNTNASMSARQTTLLHLSLGRNGSSSSVPMSISPCLTSHKYFIKFLLKVFRWRETYVSVSHPFRLILIRCNSIYNSLSSQTMRCSK